MVELKFKYKEKEYIILLPYIKSFVFKDEGSNECNWFWWEQGNGACDCNRSVFIKLQHPDFPELLCGHEIELLDYKIIWNNQQEN